MKPESLAPLENLLRDNDLEWVIKIYAPKDRTALLEGLLKRLNDVSAEYRRRTQASVAFTPEMLIAEADPNPHKVRAFLQALVTAGTVEMLVMVWRVLQGLTIHEVEMKYCEGQQFDLVVVLARPSGDKDPPYRSSNINDAGLIRHFGITTIDGKPLFDGFFSLRKH